MPSIQFCTVWKLHIFQQNNPGSDDGFPSVSLLIRDSNLIVLGFQSVYVLRYLESKQIIINRQNLKMF